MAWPLYATFVLAVTALLLLPGPNVALIVATSLDRGSRAGLATVAGTSAAMVPQLALTSLGMNALIAGAAQAFSTLRWAGVAYLAWLAFRAFTAPATPLVMAPERRGRLFWRGFLVSLSNPKTLLFFAAFFPQFVDARAALGPQLFLMSATFLGLALLIDSGWVMAAARAGRWLRLGGRARNRLTGGLLLGAGIGLALARRP
jgi:homoserine/homoserine lactone efflux protein